MKKSSKQHRSKYPSGRPGGSENVWNFSKSYERSAMVNIPGVEKFSGENVHGGADTRRKKSK
jgi:hypothetical protein